MNLIAYIYKDDSNNSDDAELGIYITNNLFLSV